MCVHRGKYPSTNKLQDNFAFLALVMLLNPSTDIESFKRKHPST